MQELVQLCYTEEIQTFEKWLRTNIGLLKAGAEWDMRPIANNVLLEFVKAFTADKITEDDLCTKKKPA